MRTVMFPLSALLCFFSSLLVHAQSVTAGDTSPSLQIPAVVSKTIRAEKVRPGDEVRFDVLEAILVGHGVVIPSNAHLRGHVVESAPITASSASRLSIEIDWAEWRRKRMPLRAFIYGLGMRKFEYEPAGAHCSAGEGPAQFVARPSIPSNPQQQPDCDTPWSIDNRAADFRNDSSLRQLKLETNLSDGSTALVSTRKSIHLAAGVLVMLRDVPVKTASNFREIAEQK